MLLGGRRAVSRASAVAIHLAVDRRGNRPNRRAMSLRDSWASTPTRIPSRSCARSTAPAMMSSPTVRCPGVPDQHGRSVATAVGIGLPYSWREHRQVVPYSWRLTPTPVSLLHWGLDATNHGSGRSIYIGSPTENPEAPFNAATRSRGAASALMFRSPEGASSSSNLEVSLHPDSTT